MISFIFQYWLEIIFSVFLAGVGYLVKKYVALGFGIQALLRDRIIQAHNYYLDKGHCPIYAKENVEEMYKRYHNLGGNGTMTTLYESLMEMPTERRAEE